MEIYFLLPAHRLCGIVSLGNYLPTTFQHDPPFHTVTFQHIFTEYLAFIPGCFKGYLLFYLILFFVSFFIA